MIEDVTRELELDLDVQDAWSAITDPTLLSEWLAEDVSMDLVPGGDAAFVVDGEPRDGWVEEVSAPRDGEPGRLVFWWQTDGEPASRVELEVRVSESGSGSQVRVSETRPLELLDLVGRGLPGVGGMSSGPMLVAVAG